MWIFAYGSLIYRPGFAYVERRTAYLHGWARRFWQGSPDHRGVPDAPGRVATLVPAAGEACGGCVYRIEPHTAAEVLAMLDAREQAGFVRRTLPVHAASAPGPPFAEALAYVADAANPHFLGPLGEREIAEWIGRSRGPSGANADYLLALAAALDELGIADAHVREIAAFLARIQGDEQGQ